MGVHLRFSRFKDDLLQRVYSFRMRDRQLGSAVLGVRLGPRGPMPPCSQSLWSPSTGRSEGFWVVGTRRVAMVTVLLCIHYPQAPAPKLITSMSLNVAKM